MNTSWWVKPSELKPEQRSIVELPAEESTLIIGPPGSGKTNLLLLKASQLVRLKKPNVLILVFTRTLREFIATGGSRYAFSVDKIKTCNAWAAEFLRAEGCTPVQLQAFDDQRRELMEQVRKLIEKEGFENYYDAIVLDEAQDYNPGEIAIFKQLAPIIYAAADAKQQIYENAEDYFDNLLNQFDGKVYELKYHYRNGKRICQMADELGKVRKNYQFMLPTCNYDDDTYPSSVSVIPKPTIDDQVHEAIAMLKIQMDAYPGHLLGVICPNKAILGDVMKILSEDPINNKIAKKTGQGAAILFDEDTPICVCTAHSSKGLEFRALHVIEAPSIKGKLTRNVAYTVVTRSKTSLSIYHSKPLPPYLEKAVQFLQPSVKKVELEDLF